MLPCLSLPVMVIRMPPSRPSPELFATFTLVASGISSLLVRPREWTKFMPPTTSWAPESVIPGIFTDLVVTLGRGNNNS